VAQRTGKTHLQKDAIGVIGIVFFVIAAAAPLAAVAGVAPIIFGTAGNTGAPGAYLLVTIVLLLFSVGFAAMSRYVSGPGGFAVYIARAFGLRSGTSASFVALLGYNGFMIGNAGLFGFLAEPLFSDKLGVHLSWWAWTLAALVVIGILGYREVTLSAKVLGVLLCLEIVIILILDVAIFGAGGDSGITVSGFAPDAIFSGAAGITIMLAFACFVGFEATTLYGEEARDRKRTIPRATYVAVLFVGAFYVLAMWAFQVGYGNDAAAAKGVDDPGNFIFTLSDRYVGGLSTDVMNWLVLTSIFACVLAFHNALSRYMFALGRDRVFPSRLGRSHEVRESPHNASLAQTAIAIAIVGLFALAGGDPYLELYSWFVGVGAVAILVLYMCASVAVMRFLRTETPETRVWLTTVAPTLAALGLGAAVYLAVDNFSVLTASTSDLINALWLLVPIVALLGFALPPRSRHDAADDLLMPVAPEPVLSADQS